jgi:hypothetical protein
MPDLVPPPPDLVGNKMRSHHFPEIPQVDGPGGRQPGRDDDRFAGGSTLRLLDDLIRETGDPVGGLGALSHDRHVLFI